MACFKVVTNYGLLDNVRLTGVMQFLITTPTLPTSFPIVLQIMPDGSVLIVILIILKIKKFRKCTSYYFHSIDIASEIFALREQR